MKEPVTVPIWSTELFDKLLLEEKNKGSGLSQVEINHISNSFICEQIHEKMRQKAEISRSTKNTNGKDKIFDGLTMR